MPLFFAVGVAMFALLGRQTPRAVIRVDREKVSVTGSRDDSLGRQITFASWRRKTILEFRANKVDKGLWLRIAGEDSLHLMPDLPKEWCDQIGTAITRSLEKYRESDIGGADFNIE